MSDEYNMRSIMPEECCRKCKNLRRVYTLNLDFKGFCCGLQDNNPMVDSPGTTVCDAFASRSSRKENS